MNRNKKIAILGSTGSIGRSALDVIRSVDGLSVLGLSGHTNIELLKKQFAEFNPRHVVISDESASSSLASEFAPASINFGADALVELATLDEVDVVIASIVGSAGLKSTWAAVAKGKTVALANKETLVVAGQQIMELARKSGSIILPVDSEHSAVFQALQCGKSNEVHSVILTASGGPFREFDSGRLKCVTVEQALAHPTWDMGQKITIDSATMMNKALEIIEARWLFGLAPDQIKVAIHPQSIIHSLVEFVDGSVMAQMSPPDMKLPIQYALRYPERVAGPSPRLDFSEAMQLELSPPDLDRFPALKLGYEVAKTGGTSGAVLNAANEAAVSAFLNREISFTDIVAASKEVLEQHNFESEPDLDGVIAADQWARKEMSKWIAC